MQQPEALDIGFTECLSNGRLIFSGAHAIMLHWLCRDLIRKWLDKTSSNMITLDMHHRDAILSLALSDAHWLITNRTHGIVIMILEQMVLSLKLLRTGRVNEGWYCYWNFGQAQVWQSTFPELCVNGYTYVNEDITYDRPKELVHGAYNLTVLLECIIHCWAWARTC